MRISTRCAGATALLATGLAVCPVSGGISASAFDQLSWYGIAENQPLSPWGRLTFEFDRQSDLRFLNLSIRRPGDAEPTWVIRNLGVAGYPGVQLDRISATFDLGIAAAGEMVTRFDYGITLGTAMDDGPVIDSFNAEVNQVDYQIVGIEGQETGNPKRPPPPKKYKGDPVLDAVLPGRDDVENQKQGYGDCVQGAIVTSLKYLQKTGRAGSNLPVTIDEWNKFLGRDPGPQSLTPDGWEHKKKEYFQYWYPEHNIEVEIVEGGMTKENLERIAKAVREGRDVEIVGKGHVAMVAGVRVYANGCVELDLFDDNQMDDDVDEMTTVQGTIGGELGGRTIERFVIEIPAPSTAVALTASVGMAFFTKGRRKRSGGCSGFTTGPR